MSTAITEYVQKLDDKDIWQIIREYEEFEENRSIGDCTLRTHAENIQKEFGGASVGIMMWMNALAFECLRYFAHKYGEVVEENNRLKSLLGTPPGKEGIENGS